ncbi:hypothetical protein C900_04949 [Fulvivirga imtechensis AK7]|uniref:Uncharacterized protein n=2 Tax=Fulvivirga TaxID=396811 RepID=L8JPW2_9BACT|nr:hypothetical protein C900_04949 [Fulvivirga imtechensis AK7]
MHQNQASLGNGVKIGENLYTSIPEPKELEGNPYLYEDWYRGKIFFKQGGDSVVSNQIKYNLFTNYIEIFVDKQPRGVDAVLINKFELTDHMSESHIFLACTEIDAENIPKAGFCEVLVDNTISLVRKPFINIKPANYDQALMVGNRNDKILNKEEFYVLYEGKGYLIKNKRSMKDFLDVVGLRDKIKVGGIDADGIQDLVYKMNQLKK